MGTKKKNSPKASEQAIRQQTQAMVIIHCNERYHNISTKLDGALESVVIKRVSNIQAKTKNLAQSEIGMPVQLELPELQATEKLIRYYLSYWLLQWDQHMFYHNGLLPSWIYESWLRQRYEDFNFASAIDHILPKPSGQDPEVYTSKRAALAEQELYRDGWIKAKQFYGPLKKGFAEFADYLDILMQAEDRKDREKALHELLKIDFIRLHEGDHE